MHTRLQSQLQSIGLDRSDILPNIHQWENLLSIVSDEYTSLACPKPSSEKSDIKIKPEMKNSSKINEKPIKQYAARVLIVEDNEVNKQVAKHILEIFGCEVTDVADGSQALQILEISNFDIIFMDCQMPIMDGIEATKLLRKKELGTNQHVTIIALTANVIDDTKNEYLNAGMDDFLCKPFTIPEMQMKLETWVKHKKIISENESCDTYNLFNYKLFEKLMIATDVENISIGKDIFSTYLAESNKLIAIINDKTQSHIDKHCLIALDKLLSASESIGAMCFIKQCEKLRISAESKDLSKIQNLKKEFNNQYIFLVKQIQCFLQKYGVKIDLD